MRPVLAAFLLFLSSPAPAQSLDDCRKLSDPAQRLSCFDKPQAPAKSAPTKSVPAKTAGSGDAKLLVDGQARIKRLLREPDSAKFSDVAVHVSPDGEKVVCGKVNAKNGFGGMTGNKDFYVHSKVNRIVVSGRADENPMSGGGDILAMLFTESIKEHAKYCK